MSGKYLVVGGTSGIGRSLAETLQSLGHEVLVASRTTPEGSNLTHITYDATSDTPLDLPWDSLDGIAYCPGSINLKPFHRLKTDDFLADFQLNAMGAVKVIQQVLPLLKNSANPSVLLFSTVAVQQGMSFHSSIAMSKGAIEGLTRSLAAELAPKVRVNCIAPSIVDTPLASRLLSSEEKTAASAKRHPLQRVGKVDDIAKAGAYLLSSDSLGSPVRCCL